MKHVRPLYLPPAYQEAPDHGRLILRDGSTASIRLAAPGDLGAVKYFYAHLSTQSRRMRFFSEFKPGEDVLAALCDSSRPEKSMTLLVWRFTGETERIIATGSYIANSTTAAEFAVAVDDSFQGKGLGGLLLERLSVLAASRGFTRFNAFMDISNHAMIETFRHSGFQLREDIQDGMVEVNFSLAPGEASAALAAQRDRICTKASLRPFFCPQSIAVIGASRDPGRLGHRLFMTVLRQHFRGIVYPVNPQAAQVSGVKAYPTAADLPEPVDLALIAVPRDEVLACVEQCARRGVRAVIIVSAGFAEHDATGAALQQQLRDRVRGYGMRMLGPNCLGLITNDPDVQLNASMSTIVPAPGAVAISSQSGALGMALLQLAKTRNLGIASFVSMGNKADVTGNDLLYYWEDDPATRVILMYLESFGNPRRFGRIAREVSRRKPIVCVKSGHRDDAVVNALFRQSGVIRMTTLEEMFDVAALLGTQPLPAGPRTAVITNSRGAGKLASDAGESDGLAVSHFVDLSAAATPRDFQRAIDDAARSSDVDALIIIYMPVISSDAAAFLAMMNECMPKKTTLLVMMREAAHSTVLPLGESALPCFLFPESAAHALAAAARYRAWRDAPPGTIPDFDDADFSRARAIIHAAPFPELSAGDAASLLSCAGIRPAGTVTNAELFDIETTMDPVFGPVLSLHASGGAPTYRMIPLTDSDARNMMESICGNRPLDQSETLPEIILRISLLVEELHEIEHVRLSGIAVSPTGNAFAIGQTLIRISPAA